MINLSGDDFIADPYPAYQQLLAMQGAYYEKHNDLWYVAGYADVKHVLGNKQQFAYLPTGIESTFSGSNKDDHKRARSVIKKAFIRPTLDKELCKLDGLIDAFAAKILSEGDEFDFVADYAARIPVAVLIWMIGGEYPSQHPFRAWSFALLNHAVPAKALPEHESTECGLEVQYSDLAGLVADLDHYVESLVEVAIDQGSDGWLMTLLVDACRAGEIRQHQILDIIKLFMLAAQETTTHLIANATTILATKPDIKDRLWASPALLEPFIEEVLRFEAPVQRRTRVALQDVRMGESIIPCGASVVALIGAANRDPEVFDDPDTFSLDRRSNPHLSFGFGAHACPGLTLGRMEAHRAIEGLRRHFPAFEIAATIDAADFQGNLMLRALKHLPIRLL